MQFLLILFAVEDWKPEFYSFFLSCFARRFPPTPVASHGFGGQPAQPAAISRPVVGRAKMSTKAPPIHEAILEAHDVSFWFFTEDGLRLLVQDSVDRRWFTLN